MKTFIRVRHYKIRYKIYKNLLVLAGQNITELVKQKELINFIKNNNIRYVIDCCNKSFHRSFYYIDGITIKTKSEFKKEYFIKSFNDDFEEKIK